MQVLPLSEPVPADATDFAVGIQVSGVACVNNRVITLLDGDQVLCPPGWDILFDGQILMLVYDTNSEVINA